jgi:L-lactate dehydrogenase complex protein LldG
MSFDLFKTKAEAVSAEVHRTPDRAAALAFILEFLRAEDVAPAPGSWALWAPGPLADGLDQATLSAALPGLSFAVTRDLAAQAKVGISQAQWGLANTGSIAADSTGVEQRLVATLPWIHLAVLPTHAILPDLPSLLGRIDPASALYTTIVTGPSRTADIERVLTIGVHGPERLVIVCIDDMGQDSGEVA